MYDRRGNCGGNRHGSKLLIIGIVGAAGGVGLSAAKCGGKFMFDELCKPMAEGMLKAIGGLITSFGSTFDAIINADISAAGGAMDGVVAAGEALTSLFLCLEMFSQIAQKWLERIEDALQLWIKIIVAKILIENSSSITDGIYSYFKKLGADSLSSGLSEISSQLSSISGLDTMEGGPLGLAYLIMAVVLALILVVVFVILVMLTVEILGIAFEIAIHQAVAPIALSTLCNSTFRSAGISFIKSYSAVCLQTTVIGAIFKIYTVIEPELSISLQTGGNFLSWLFGFAMPILGLIVLCVTVKKSGDITKRMFGA